MIKNMAPFRNKFIVVDDFYPDPDYVRELALKLPKEESGSEGNYPGVMTKEGFWTEEHDVAFKYITNENVIRINTSTGLSSKFRFTKQDDQFKQFIHFDPGPNQVWSGVVYLTKPEDYTLANGEVINAGTSFWKHKETGLESIPLTQEGIEQYGWKGVDDLKVFLETDGCIENKWTKTFSVPIKYNRLVLFRPWLFHSSGVQFGTNFNNCRLIQTIFLQDATNA
jgi:hypothetical protein